jgi:hypothetical protein
LPTFGSRWPRPRIRGFVCRHPATLCFLTRIGRFDLTAEGVNAAMRSGRAGPVPVPRMRFAPVARRAPAEAAGRVARRPAFPIRPELIAGAVVP